MYPLELKPLVRVRSRSLSGLDLGNAFNLHFTGAPFVGTSLWRKDHPPVIASLIRYPPGGAVWLLLAISLTPAADGAHHFKALRDHEPNFTLQHLCRTEAVITEPQPGRIRSWLVKFRLAEIRELEAVVGDAREEGFWFFKHFTPRLLSAGARVCDTHTLHCFIPL